MSFKITMYHIQINKYFNLKFIFEKKNFDKSFEKRLAT